VGAPGLSGCFYWGKLINPKKPPIGSNPSNTFGSGEKLIKGISESAQKP